MKILFLFFSSVIAMIVVANDPLNPFNLTNCINETSIEFSDHGKLQVLSWHIHYTTNTSDMERFYDSFCETFQDYFPETSRLCPFGPNYGNSDYQYICSLEDEFDSITMETDDDSDPWSVSQRAFFIPKPFLNVTWNWSLNHQGYLDLFLHPNTGCMYDDHSKRGEWYLFNKSQSAPTIYLLEFPCNMPVTGCNDSLYPGPPSCGCLTPLESDKPEDSCPHCSYNSL